MEERFINFKAFVEKQMPNSTVALVLNHVNLQAFMLMIIKMVDEHPACEHDFKSNKICGHHAAIAIFEKLRLDPAEFTPEARVKFERYCTYFISLT